jgi:hypothetical protein
MTEIAYPMQDRPRLLRIALAAIRGRAAEARERASVSFAELVWAHHERQKEVFAGAHDGPCHREYRRRLDLFTAEHGKIVESYWCRYEASGVAVTEQKLPRKLSNFFRRDSIMRLHTATDWRTANAQEVASWLHQWETAGIKASEVLRESSERIALQWIFAATSRLLAFVDRKGDRPVAAARLKKLREEQAGELARVAEYYQRAGENSARIVYFRGMLWGTAALAGLVGGVFALGWTLGLLDPRAEPTYTLFVSVAMGAVGAILSVMTRMASPNGFSLEFEVGRKSVRYLGGLRPWIGAMFAFVLYLALKSNLVELVQASDHGVYFYGTLAFAAGFSERRARVLLDGAVGRSSDGDASTNAGSATRGTRYVSTTP